ncbi:MAG: PEGA domain-containing protein [Myxococcales bacterium]|nr:PEGA domain-containing protein [Myxococcales bacterium]
MTQTRRSTRFARSSAIALLVVLSGPTAARAGDAEEAKLHFNEAETAYRLGKYEKAIAEYEAAYKALPDAAFLFNIAQSYRQQYLIDKKVGNLQRALALYKTYLRESKTPPNRTMVLKLIEELKSVLQAVQSESNRQPKQGKLIVDGASARGAAVSIDGKHVGTAPLTRELSPGSYLLKVEREGYAPWSTTVSVAAGATVQVPVTLRSLAGSDGGAGGAAAATSRPVYKRWWFWTIIGVAVAAGVGTTVGVLATRDSGDGLPQIDLR